MLIDGAAIAAEREKKVKLWTAEMRFYKTAPKFAAILVGNDPASELYLQRKDAQAREVDIEMVSVQMPSGASIEQVIAQIRQYNADPSVYGILVQLPFPSGSPPDQARRKILDEIDPAKDIDCLTSVNIGALTSGQPRFFPATVKAVLTAINAGMGNGAQMVDWKQVNGRWLSGKTAVVIGQSEIVGKPLAVALMNMGATVVSANEWTQELKSLTRTGDILISAAGVAGLVKSDMVKLEAMVIDVGMNRTERGVAVGDVDFAAVSNIASAITPVPGGVGPLTVISLMENVIEAVRNAQSTIANKK